MGLMGIIGKLGKGKTATLTYFILKNFVSGRKIYSNYKSVIFDHEYINSFSGLESMKEGFVALDELWIWIDSRLSSTWKNRVITLIIGKSRKRGLDIGYTVQHFKQIDKRLRNITDIVCFPEMLNNDRICRVVMMTFPDLDYVKSFVYKTEPIFESYDHKEEINPLIITKEDKQKIKSILSGEEE